MWMPHPSRSLPDAPHLAFEMWDAMPRLKCELVSFVFARACEIANLVPAGGWPIQALRWLEWEKLRLTLWRVALIFDQRNAGAPHRK